MKVVKFSADPGYINVRNGMSLESCGSFRNLAVHAVPYGTPNPITYSYNLSFFYLVVFRVGSEITWNQEGKPIRIHNIDCDNLN
jgi:hypothetical protein